MLKKISFVIIGIYLVAGAQNAWAGGAVKKRQQMQQQKKLRVHQQVRVQQVAQQQLAQQVAQKAATQAAMVAQYQAQRASAEALLAGKQAAQRAMAGEIVVHRQIQQQAVEQALEAGLRQKQMEEAAQVVEVATLDDVLHSLDVSSEVWPLMIDQFAKDAVVNQYIQRYRAKGIVIQKPATYYAQMIDGMSAQAPEMLERPFEQILETVAVIEYDFDNGYNKEAMARKILGSDQAVLANKQRLGIR